MPCYRPIPATGAMPSVAVFDLDKTLIYADTTILWIEYLYKRNIVTDPHFRTVNDVMLREYHSGTMDYHQYLRDIIPAFKSLTTVPRNQVVLDFVNDVIRPRMYQEGLDRINQAKNLGMDLMIISASWSFLVQPIGRHLFGIDKSFAVDLAEEDGRITSNVVGNLPFREGKIVKLETELGKIDKGMDQTVFFTDSRNDLPLALAAGDCETVNPDPTLREAALKNGWKINNWTL